MSIAKLEYIWLDGYQPVQSLRSKTKIERGIKMDDVQYVDSSLGETISEKVGSVGKAGGLFKRLFKRNKSSNA